MDTRDKKMSKVSQETIIEFLGISKKFGSNQVFKSLCLEIYRGETLTILGSSGTGKTVLIKILLGLLLPDAGKVIFEGDELNTMDEKELRTMRRSVGMLFQGGALFDSLSVKENVAYPIREHFPDTSEKDIERIVAEKLALVGLPGIESMKPNDLSGGMKKRVSLARAIATNPEVLLYDEPTTGLDPINCHRINRLIRAIQKKIEVTSIVVTHDMASAYYVSDRLAFLHEGKIHFIGTVEEARNSEDHLVQSFISGTDDERHTNEKHQTLELGNRS
jgi:phospholipid/cholesterol/gamma-HCH transport system ATP-binding protein